MGSLPLHIAPEFKDKLIDTESGNLPYLLLQTLEKYPDLQRYTSLEIRALSEEIVLSTGAAVSNYLFLKSGGEE